MQLPPVVRWVGPGVAAGNGGALDERENGDMKEGLKADHDYSSAGAETIRSVGSRLLPGSRQAV